jgi:hypothetical protein
MTQTIIENIKSEFEHNNEGLAHLLGELLSTIPAFTDAFAKSFTEHLLAIQCISQRIKFLYQPQAHSIVNEKIFNKTVNFNIKDTLIYIEDIRGDWDHVKLALLSKNDDFVIRAYSNNRFIFWRFNASYEMQNDGYLCVQLTRRAVLMIVWVSNMLGFANP